MLNCAGNPLIPGCSCNGTSGGIELARGGVPNSLGPVRTLAVGLGNDWIDSAVGPIRPVGTGDGLALVPGRGLLLTLGFGCVGMPSSVAVLLPRLDRSGLGLVS